MKVHRLYKFFSYKTSKEIRNYYFPVFIKQHMPVQLIQYLSQSILYAQNHGITVHL